MPKFKLKTNYKQIKECWVMVRCACRATDMTDMHVDFISNSYKIQKLSMQGSNHSGIQCFEHPNQQITNYCLHFDCLKPLCPDCVQIHTKHHQKQEIESWKNCVNKSARNIKVTLDSLRKIYDKNNQYQIIKSVDVVESENVKKLNQIKDRVMKMVDDVFAVHEQKLRNIIRTYYRVDTPDNPKLKMAIEELEKILMKLGHSATVLPALKKSLLLDHESLRNYFGPLEQKTTKTQLRQWFVSENEDPIKLRPYLQDLIKINSLENDRQQATPNIYSSPNHEFRSARTSDAIRIEWRNYFNENCANKLLHFFIPTSREMKVINIDDAYRGGKWSTIEFKHSKDLPCFFKSIITPAGEIYLTGGSEDQTKCRQIYKYNQSQKSLQFVCNMNLPRSSHSVCYLNNCIYIIGGFTKANQQTLRECEVFRIGTKSCEMIAPSRFPSANSSAVAFSDNYIVKFGGVVNRESGNNLIEMYNVSTNSWAVMELKSKGIKTEFFSFSAACQISNSQILVFGGYDNSEEQRPKNTSFVLEVDIGQAIVWLKNYNEFPLPYAEGFWNNNPVVHNRMVFGLQNIFDQKEQQAAIADQINIVIFNGEKWV